MNCRTSYSRLITAAAQWSQTLSTAAVSLHAKTPCHVLDKR